jgi:hypothetical protein
MRAPVLLRFLFAPVLLGAAVAFAACTQSSSKKVDFTQVSTFRVEITSGQVGTQSVPLAFSTVPISYGLRITAIDGFAQPLTKFAGPVTISSEPGLVFGASGITFTNGVGTGTITLQRAFGITRLWVEDPVSYATGVSDPIYIRGPKIADIQTSPNTVNSPFNGQRVLVDDSSQLVVIELGRDGFYLTDIGAPGGAFGSIYAYTFGAPQGVQPGDQIIGLSGTVSEFLGFTELNNPFWKPAGTTLPIPAPHVLTCTQINAADPNLSMEQFESAEIELDNATVEVCSGFPTCPDYDTYKQWAITLPGCAMNTVSNYTLVGFDPIANHGKVFTKLKGTLRNIQFASPPWIIEPHSLADACCPTCTPALTQGC